MRLAPHLIAPAAFALAASLAGLGAVWAANVMERRSAEAVGAVLAVEGHGWATVTADGLRVTLSGTAPSEAERFRALSLAGGIVDAARVTDAMGVAAPEALTPPDYAVEILRNDAGVTLIGLVPEATDRAEIAQVLAGEWLRRRQPGLRAAPLLAEPGLLAGLMVAMVLAHWAVLTVLFVDQPRLGWQLLQVPVTVLAYPLVAVGLHVGLGLRRRPAVDGFGRRAARS